MKYIIIVLALGLLSSCATPLVSREPSAYLLSSDKSVTNLFKDLRTKFEENKYKVESEDVAAGLLLLEPRNFTFKKQGKAVSAQQKIQIRQEGGSVKIIINYECNYSGGEDSFVVCLDTDSDLTAKIKRIEPTLLAMVKPLLRKH